MKKIITLLSFFLISACSVPVNTPSPSIKNGLPVGSILRLTKTITIPADRSCMYIANGELKQLKNYNTVDIYYPYCTIHFNHESPQKRQIKPDSFEVIKIEEWERDFGRILNKYKRYVRGGGTRFIKSSSDTDGPSIVMHATIISLRSKNQPEVNELVCGHWNDAWELKPLTLQEMKTALGGLIVISATNAKNI